MLLGVVAPASAVGAAVRARHPLTPRSSSSSPRAAATLARARTARVVCTHQRPLRRAIAQRLSSTGGDAMPPTGYTPGDGEPLGESNTPTSASHAASSAAGKSAQDSTRDVSDKRLAPPPSSPSESTSVAKRPEQTVEIERAQPSAPSAPAPPTGPSRAVSATEEIELLPPSKREPRLKRSEESTSESGDGGDGVGVSIDGDGVTKSVDDGSVKGGGTKQGGGAKQAGSGAGKTTATTKTKDVDKITPPRSAPPVSVGGIKAVSAGTAMDKDSEPALAGGDDGDGNDARSGGGGGGGGDDEDGEDEDEDEDDDEVVLPDPWYKLAWEETERELTKLMQRLLNIWITRDPSKTTRLVLFSVLGTALFVASLLLYPENPLEFSDDGLFSSVFGRNPRWVVNRELGPVQPTLLSTTCACAVAFAKVRLGANMFRLSPFMHGVLGLPMGFMLVFRWNNAHERWWYGRTCLGNILFYCKNLGGTFCTWVAPQDPMLAARTLGLIGALKETVADRLNGTVMNDGAILSQLTTPLDSDDLEGLFLADNKVLYCLEQLRGCVMEAFRKDYVPPAIASTIHNEVAMIMDNYGSCEKVVNQPPPGCIITHLKSTLMVYVCSLPMILVHEVGVWGVVPVTTILSLALFGIEAAAEQIEQPFGNRPYDLPVRSLMNSNTRDLEQTSRRVLGLAGFVNGVKMPLEPRIVAPVKPAMNIPEPPIMMKPMEAPEVPAKIPPTPTPASVPAPAPAPATKSTSSATVAPAQKKTPRKPGDLDDDAVADVALDTSLPTEKSVMIPSMRKDNTVSFSSDRIESAVASASKEIPFAFNTDTTVSTTRSADAVRPGSSDDTGESQSQSAATPHTPKKSALQAAMDAVSNATNGSSVPSGSLSPIRTRPTFGKAAGDLPAWKAQSPIEIYDQVLDERPSTTIPDSPRYHTSGKMRRRDSYGEQFFEMFRRGETSTASASNTESHLQRTTSSTLPRSASTTSFQGSGSPTFRTNAEGERDIRDIPFSRNAFRSSPSRSDLTAEEDGAVPMRRLQPSQRAPSYSDMTALEEAIKRAREARRRNSPGGGTP